MTVYRRSRRTILLNDRDPYLYAVGGGSKGRRSPGVFGANLKPEDRMCHRLAAFMATATPEELEAACRALCEEIRSRSVRASLS